MEDSVGLERFAIIDSTLREGEQFVRAEFTTVGHANADRTHALDENAIDLGADDHRAASSLDGWQHAGGDLAGPSNRIRRAIEIVLGNRGVSPETALAGRQAVVAPLGREHGLQFSTGTKPVEHFSGRAPGDSQERRA